jgi:hypothetical protein
MYIDGSRMEDLVKAIIKEGGEKYLPLKNITGSTHNYTESGFFK